MLANIYFIFISANIMLQAKYIVCISWAHNAYITTKLQFWVIDLYYIEKKLGGQQLEEGEGEKKERCVKLHLHKE